MRLSGWRCRLANRSAMNSAHISYAARPDSTKQAEIATLASVYSFVIKCSQAKKAAVTAAGSDNPEKQERS